jgi:hypothetical protein
MPAREDKLDRQWHTVNEEVSSRGLLVFPGSISLQAPWAMWPTGKGIGPFLDMALALGCRVLYVHSRSLTPDELIAAVSVSLASIIDALDADLPEQSLEQAGVAAEPVAMEFLQYAKQYYGRRMNVSVEWVYEGVVHRFSEFSDWYGPLLDKGSDVAELIDAREDSDFG